MFDFFKKKRIAKYLQAVGGYVASTFRPEPEKKPNGIRYSMRSSGVQYKLPQEENGETAHIRYSDRQGLDDIPNDGDRFLEDALKLFQCKSISGRTAQQVVSMLDNYLNLTFVDILTRYINKKGWRDSRVYKAAQMDRRLFSKIMSDRNYKPSKDTALALVIALELSLKQANDLLSRAGYTLSHSNKRDVIIEYFIREGIYDLSDINEVLYNLDQKIIGR